jgi:hypothetical protein
VAHEALVRHWERLRGWLNEDREFLLWRQRTQIHVAFEWFVTPEMHTEREGAIHMKSKNGWVSGPTPLWLLVFFALTRVSHAQSGTWGSLASPGYENKPVSGELNLRRVAIVRSQTAPFRLHVEWHTAIHCSQVATTCCHMQLNYLRFPERLAISGVAGSLH